MRRFRSLEYVVAGWILASLTVMEPSWGQEVQRGEGPDGASASVDEPPSTLLATGLERVRELDVLQFFFLIDPQTFGQPPLAGFVTLAQPGQVLYFHRLCRGLSLRLVTAYLLPVATNGLLNITSFSQPPLIDGAAASALECRKLRDTLAGLNTGHEAGPRVRKVRLENFLVPRRRVPPTNQVGTGAAPAPTSQASPVEIGPPAPEPPQVIQIDGQSFEIRRGQVI